MAESESSQNVQFVGKNIQLFRVRMRGVFKQFVDSISEKRFAEIFSGVLEEKLSKRLFKKWQEKVFDDSLQDLDDFIAEEKFDEKLKELENVIKHNQLNDSVVAWRPPGNPREHMRSLDIQENLKIKKELEEFVNKKEASVNQLMAEVQAGRIKTLEFHKRTDATINNLQKSEASEEKIQSNAWIHEMLPTPRNPIENY